MVVSSTDGPLRPDSSGEADMILKGHLGQFTLAYLKALMTTGIYPSDHPAVLEVSGEPFLHLKRLAPTTNEITFMSASAAIGDEIMVEGVLAEGIPFTTILHSSMGEIFAKKFVSYFERNQLVSFSIKTRIGKEEFQKLISVFAEHRVKDEGGGHKDPTDFSDMLLNRGIVHVSAMVRSEIIGGERPLPWRVKMAISRLRKDLRNIPYYAKASSQELAEAKRALVQDITRPLRRPQFLKDLLANTDLITHDMDELEEKDIQEEVIQGLHPGMLVNISWDIVGDLERASWGAIHQNVGGKERRLDEIFKDLLKTTAMCLQEWEPETVKSLMEHLFAKKILIYAELPEALQIEMRLDKWTKQFLGNWKQILSRMDTLADESVYAEYLKTLVPVFPEVIKRGRSEVSLNLLRLLGAHSRNVLAEAPGRTTLAREALESFSSEANLAHLIGDAKSPERERRQTAFECLQLIGEPAVGSLLELLWRSTSASVRRETVAILEFLGEDVYVPLMEVLGTKHLEWYVYRNAVLLAAKTDCEAASDDVCKYLSHPHPRVREEAISALSHFRGKSAMLDFVPLLSDTDASVRRKAIALLARFQCRVPLFLSTLANSVKAGPGKPGAVPEPVALAALEAIKSVGVFESDGVDIRAPLLRNLDREDSKLKQWFKKKQKVVNDDRFRCAVLDTLAVIGDEAVATRLKPVLRDSSPPVRAKAAAAIKSIRERGKTS
jgi:HEAT repeat protein